MPELDPAIKSQILALEPMGEQSLQPEQQQALARQVEKMLEGLVAQLDLSQHDSVKYGPGRPRILPCAMLWIGVLLCTLRGYTSQLALHRLLHIQGFWSYHPVDICDQTVYNRLEAEGITPFIEMFSMVSTLLFARLNKLQQEKMIPWVTDIVAIDQTTLDQVSRTLPALRKVIAGSNKLIPGKLSALFDIRHQLWRQILYVENPEQNEKKSARATIAGLRKGTLILADLGYFAFRWFDELTDQGYFWLSRLREKTSYTAIFTFYQDATTFDGLIWLGNYRADRAAHAVRLVEFVIGGHKFQYITNVCDPMKLSIAEIAALYARRWDIELAFKMIKRYLHLHIFWSAKHEVILQQVWSGLIVAQILLALRSEIALVAGVDTYDVSMQLMVENLPQYSAPGTDIVAWFVKYGDVGFIRPSSRKKWEAPQVATDMIKLLPPELVVTRIPRYAEKDCETKETPSVEVIRNNKYNEKKKQISPPEEDMCVGALPKRSKAAQEQRLCAS